MERCFPRTSWVGCASTGGTGSPPPPGGPLGGGNPLLTPQQKEHIKAIIADGKAKGQGPGIIAKRVQHSVDSL